MSHFSIKLIGKVEIIVYKGLLESNLIKNIRKKKRNANYGGYLLFEDSNSQLFKISTAIQQKP
jgi:hypothetical protein